MLANPRDCAKVLIRAFSAPSPTSRNWAFDWNLQLAGRVEQGFQPVRHAHGADIADQKLSFGVKFPSQRVVGCGWCRRKQISLDAIFDNCNFFRGNAPVPHQMFLERGSLDDDVIGSLVEKRRDGRQPTMQQGAGIAGPNGGQ
ncbi:MAG: hypothetical protein WA830_26170 [Candidatus Sulfotelmatobacter sp.]